MLLTCTSNTAFADDAYTLTADGRKFEPATLEVPAGKKFKLTVKNTGAKAIEFESDELNREKVIPAGASAVIGIGPLKPGAYPFFDEFNESVKGQIVAK